MEKNQVGVSGRSGHVSRKRLYAFLHEDRTGLLASFSSKLTQGECKYGKGDHENMLSKVGVGIS